MKGPGMPPLGGGGKGSVRQKVGPHARTTIVPGDPLSRMAGQYGKGHSFGGPPAGDPSTTEPIGEAAQMPHAKSSDSMIRGASGGIRKRPRTGGLSEGQQDYSKSETVI